MLKKVFWVSLFISFIAYFSEIESFLGLNAAQLTAEAYSKALIASSGEPESVQQEMYSSEENMAVVSCIAETLRLNAWTMEQHEFFIAETGGDLRNINTRKHGEEGVRKHFGPILNHTCF